MPIEPYLNFDGRCEEAIEFYKKALNAECTMLMRFNESPDPCPPGMTVSGDKVMHATLNIGGAIIMASDCYSKGNPQFQGVTLSLSVKDEATATKAFNALADGGQIHMPLGKTFFSKIFGMVADKFGVPWMVIVPKN